MLFGLLKIRPQKTKKKKKKAVGFFFGLACNLSNIADNWRPFFMNFGSLRFFKIFFY